MTEFFNHAAAWLGSGGNLALPLALTFWMAWGDIKTRLIPNYLTLGTALSGLAYNLMFHGWAGLQQGIIGMMLGFSFLILIYIWGGMGAGDVKAFAALGAWLGPWLILQLFCCMGIAGGILALGVLWWKGLLWAKAKHGWSILLNLILCTPDGLKAPAPPSQTIDGIPYGVAMALGMVALVGLGG